MSGRALISSTVGSLSFSALNDFSHFLISARTACMRRERRANKDKQRHYKTNMNFNRPRQSLLSLFDPLADSVSTDSDNKENNNLSLSLFSNPTHNPSVTVPRKRLIDIGDTTLDDASFPEHSSKGVDDGQLQTHLKTPQPRTPFAELTLADADATPLARLRTQPPPPSTQSLLPQSVNLASDEEQRPSSHASPRLATGDTNTNDILISLSGKTSDIEPPQIVISCTSVDDSPETISQRAFHDIPATILTTSPPQQLASSQASVQSTTHSTLHLRAPNTTSHDINRFSVDLQASFQMYLQSEASFDLLNDNISLMEPMEPLLNDDEHFDFELEKDKLQDALGKFKRGRSDNLCTVFTHSDLPCC
jgi:hypothetical protein